MRYLDTNVIIYAIENHPQYGTKCKEILRAVQNGTLEVCASLMVLVEVLTVLYKLNKILVQKEKVTLNIEKNIEALLSLPIVWYDLNFTILKHASRYTFKISPGDYIHLATMEINSVGEILSADAELDKVRFIQRIDPRDFQTI